MRRFIAHKANVDGPFYVVNGECMACGAPESEADELIAHDESGYCFFSTQPTNLEQVDAAIRALWASCCGALRYAGKDQSILARIAEIGESEKCDENIASTSLKIRSRVTFAYESDDASGESSLKSIVRFISSTRTQGQYSRCTNFQFSKSEASFVFHWYTDCSIKFRVKQVSGERWLVSLEDNDRATIGNAMSLDKSLRAGRQFTAIRWFTEDEKIDGLNGGTTHPY
ncbi:MAG TPA: hypothetical protein VK716_11925 [Terracidiphilus sp.]|jgi:hypothetical protein|nr:hypothetical protein [Terracidiphilus sp.]